MAATYYFAIVGSNDNPLYETELSSSSKSATNFDPSAKDDHRHLNQFIIHSALDVVEEVQWNNQAPYLKVIDRFNEFYVSAFVTAGNTKLLLLHDVKSEDSIKNFFNEVHEMYIKTVRTERIQFNDLIARAVVRGHSSGPTDRDSLCDWLTCWRLKKFLATVWRLAQDHIGEMSDGFYNCSIGVTAPTPLGSLGHFVEEATQTGHDFVVVPIANENYKRVLFESAASKADMDQWRAGLPLTPNDLMLKTVDWAGVSTGVFSDWIDLESQDDRVRINSELAIKQEGTWAAHLGLPSVLVPVLPSSTISNFARVMCSMASILPYAQILIRVPMSKGSEATGWLQWNTLYNLAEQHPKLNVALELSSYLPEDEYHLERWFAEPIKAVIIPANVFISNQKGYPVLPKRHQMFIKSLMTKFKPSIIIAASELGLHKAGGPEAYQEYIRYLNRSLPPPNDVERFSVGYQDYLQAPLQPLMDNLESATYETFEKDPVKYQQYEKAVYHALLDRVPEGSDAVTVIMVVGAGRGPLVNCSIRAAEQAKRRVKLYAVEKNPNALVTLQNMKNEVWHDLVTIVFSDMRKWKAPEKCDILVSELLGSFGDNELSPECLDGAQKFLKPDGISIPSSYTTYIAPLSSTKLCNEVAAYKDLEHSETPYVVMFQQVSQIAEPESIWSFHHPNMQDFDGDSDPLHNLHNVRFQTTTFEAKESTTMHGIAGYFESVLYKDVMISIHPSTHSPEMFSWFPIFFPLRTPIFIPQGATITVDFWRLTDNKKVWYEWRVSQSLQVGDKKIELGTSPLHNIGGRSSWIGL